jgi:glucose dehydrogenase
LAEQSDVLIVGSGVAGALIAWSLARAGARVTVVEAGPEVDRGAALARLERAAIRVPEAPYESAPYAESPATIKDTYIRQDGPEPFRSTYLRVVGGTTWHWLGTALRLLPSDLELRSRYGIGVDWPLAWSDLAPWYDVAEAELGVAGHDDDVFGPARQRPYPMPGLPAAMGDRLMDRVAGPFGVKVRVSPQARNSRVFDGRPACCASASCIPICPVQAKYDATVHLGKAKAAGARVLSDSVAVRLDIGPDDLVSGIVIRRPDRSETELQARELVIAAHAIEGPKLLLMSRSERVSRWRREPLGRGGALSHGPSGAAHARAVAGGGLAAPRTAGGERHPRAARRRSSPPACRLAHERRQPGLGVGGA